LLCYDGRDDLYAFVPNVGRCSGAVFFALAKIQLLTIIAQHHRHQNIRSRPSQFIIQLPSALHCIVFPPNVPLHSTVALW
jgi:hypothetical protein